VAKPELAGRLDHSIKDKVKSADVFFAFLSSLYLPARAEEGRRPPLTLIEFDLALMRLVDSAGKLPLLGLVVLDDTGRRWWENRCAEEDILNLVGEQAYLYAKHETKDEPRDVDDVRYDIRNQMKKIRELWDHVAQKTPPAEPSTIASTPPSERAIVLLGHPGVESDPEVKAGLDEIEDLLTNEGKAPQRWRDGWRTACTNAPMSPTVYRRAR
jgi:hypothetical protein